MTESQLTERFTTMIVGVRNTETLHDVEKNYIIEMLEDQLKLELICLEYDPVPESISRLVS